MSDAAPGALSNCPGSMASRCSLYALINIRQFIIVRRGRPFAS